MIQKIALSGIFSLLILCGFTQGNCSEEDLAYMGANLEFVQQVATDCGTECLFAGPACVQECMSAQLPLTSLCIDCFSNQVDCVVDNCFFECAFSPGSEGCTNCVSSNCLAPFNDCAGIVDLDGDTWTNLSDCNDGDALINPGATEIWYDGVDQNCDEADDFDQDMDGDAAFEYGGTDCNDLDDQTFNDVSTFYLDNDGDGFGNEIFTVQDCSQPTGYAVLFGDCNDIRNDIYPGAPGTMTDDDNNCDGVVDGDEIAPECIGDFNNDLAITSADLLFLLSNYGCISPPECLGDVNGDGAVGTADLLFFLTVFGSLCQ